MSRSLKPATCDQQPQGASARSQLRPCLQRGHRLHAACMLPRAARPRTPAEANLRDGVLDGVPLHGRELELQVSQDDGHVRPYQRVLFEHCFLCTGAPRGPQRQPAVRERREPAAPQRRACDWRRPPRTRHADRVCCPPANARARPCMAHGASQQGSTPPDSCFLVPSVFCVPTPPLFTSGPHRPRRGSWDQAHMCLVPDWRSKRERRGNGNSINSNSNGNITIAWRATAIASSSRPMDGRKHATGRANTHRRRHGARGSCLRFRVKRLMRSLQLAAGARACTRTQPAGRAKRQHPGATGS